MKLEVGKVYRRKGIKKFIEVKEITYMEQNLLNKYVPYAIVCSGLCDFVEDAKTTISRKVIYYNEFKEKFEEYVEDNWNFKEHSGMVNELVVTQVKKLKEKILEDIGLFEGKPASIAGEELRKIINKRFGF